MNQEVFNALKKAWKEETGYRSVGLSDHWAYHLICSSGYAVVPFIIEDLKVEPDHWFSALRFITGVHPIPEDHRGKIKLMAQDWINWYDQQKTTDNVVLS